MKWIGQIRVLTCHSGSCSEFVKCVDCYIGLKPSSMSFEDAASIPLAALTALQALRKYDGDLTGKTVFIPAGCMVLLSDSNAFSNDISERNGTVCMPACQECIPRGQSHHYGFDVENSKSKGTAG